VVFVPSVMSLPFREHDLFVVAVTCVDTHVFDVVGLFVVHLASEYVLLSEPLQVTFLI